MNLIITGNEKKDLTKRKQKEKKNNNVIINYGMITICTGDNNYEYT